MPTFYDAIPDSHAEWAMAQSVFFVASAPTYGKHVNVSPKGLPSASFSVINPNLCAYVDVTGSGCETISHVQENGRVTIMFCSFETAPRIMRFFCKGRVIEWDNEKERNAWIKKMDTGTPPTGSRAIIVLEVFKSQISCGFGVPLLGLGQDDKDPNKPAAVFKDRETMGHWAGKQVEKGTMIDYQAEWNSSSLDGLPGLWSRSKHPVWDHLKTGAQGKARGLWSAAGATVLVAILSSSWTVIALWYLGLLQSYESKRV